MAEYTAYQLKQRAKIKASIDKRMKGVTTEQMLKNFDEAYSKKIPGLSEEAYRMLLIELGVDEDLLNPEGD